MILSSIGAGIAVSSYITFAITNNPAATSAFLTLAAFAACPAICVAAGGSMWLVQKIAGRNIQINSKEECTCKHHNDNNNNKKELVNNKTGNDIIKLKEKVNFEN